MWQRTTLAVCPRLSIISNCALRRFSDKISNSDDTKDTISPELKVTELLDGAANFNEVTDTSWTSSPYPEGAAIPSDKPVRPKLDPQNTSIFLFPGQGTLQVGQINNYLHYPRVKELFDIANGILKYDILDMCLNGPQKKLNRTEYNQVATVLTSLAALEKLWDDGPRAIDTCKAVAGYSVGEITALIFSGALNLEDGIKLAAIRGAAMQYAADLQPQGMLSVFCRPQAHLGKIMEEARNYAMDLGVSEPVCSIAIYSYPEGKIFAGSEAALNYIEKSAVKLCLRKLQRLPVSGAFHTTLMKPAIKSFKKALDNIELQEPRIDVYSNFTAKPYRNSEQIRKLLLKQMYSPVRWEQIMHTIYTRAQGTKFPKTYDLGSHGTLITLLGRVNLKAAETCVKI